MNKLNFDFQSFGEQLVRLYNENHLEDSVDSGFASTVDDTVSQWNQAEAPTLDSVSKLATYEVQRRSDLDDRLRTNLSGVASDGFTNYATRQVDLAVQQATVQLAFQDYFRDFMFDSQGQPTEKAKELMEGESESQGFRKSVVTAYHHFCRDFQLDESFRDNTQQVVDTFQRGFMQSDFRHLMARYNDVGSHALKEAGYKE